MSSTLATVGILSIGEMGLGIAKLLLAHNYRVVTNVNERGEETKKRAQDGNIEMLSSDQELVEDSDYILSIVPPKDALSTAERILEAVNDLPNPKETPLYFLELNAIAPQTARTIASIFQGSNSVVVIDGGIIGGTPRFHSSTETITTMSTPQNLSPTLWTRPSIPTSGPHTLSDAPKNGSHLATTLNVKHITSSIGSASGLKMCFASTTKGFIAIAIQAFTTAQELGVLDELKSELHTFTPGMLKSAEGGMAGMAPKAYRWIREMEEIAATYADEGGFEETLFRGVAGVYRSVVEDTVLGLEKTGDRKRGRTLEDVAAAVGEGLKASKKKRT